MMCVGSSTQKNYYEATVHLKDLKFLQRGEVSQWYINSPDMD